MPSVESFAAVLLLLLLNYILRNVLYIQERPHHSDSTASRLLSEVKHCRARLLLRWGTTLESLVLFFLTFYPSSFFSFLPPVLRPVASSQGVADYCP